MATLEERIQFSKLQQVVDRMRASLISCALQVTEEGEGVPNRENRQALAFQVLANPEAVLARFIYAMAYGSSEIVDIFEAAGKDMGSVPDDAFQSIVAALWDVQANVAASLRGPAVGGIPGINALPMG